MTVALIGAGNARLAAQAILTITPGATAGTVAGTGNPGYSGDNGAATGATFSSPRAVAYDASGNLYIADSDNNVIRKVSSSGTVTTVAGTGQQGFGGDGGSATSAWLDTPTGIAVDAHGNIYIADSHNNRIREVSGGTITTIAGSGTASFSGDGGAATGAQLDLPSAVAVDASGNLYIADTNNNRIREVRGGIITTIAGDGVQGFAGDGGAATAASLDSPTGVAVDASGNVFLADRSNHRIREVSGGTIQTVVGSGAVNFSGGYGGDGGSATAAALARPSGVAIDAAGNLYIADTDNQRLRKVGNGAIATIAGSGVQGYGGDNGVATAALFNAPRGAALDSQGNVVVADRLNQRLRSVNLPQLTFPSQGSGAASTAQYVTLANTGTATLVLQSMTFTGSFQAASGGTCSALPISLGAGASCTEAIVFFPAAAGSFSGNVVVAGSGVVPQTILLSGTAAESAAVPVLTSSLNPSVYGASVTFTATMPSGSNPVPTGTVTFNDGTTALATVSLAGGSASYTTSALVAGSHAITAAYSGDGAWSAETSLPLTQTVTQAISAITLTTSVSPVFLDNPVTLAATVTSTSTPTGTVSFFNQTTLLGSSPLNAGVATLSISTLPLGTQSITAVYSGNANFTTVTSTAISEQVENFSLNFAAGSVTSSTIEPGGTATYQLVISPLDGTTFPAAITLSTSGLPSGATASFTPGTLSPGSGTTNVTMTITVARTSAALHKALGHSAPPLLLSLLLLPFARRMRRTGRRMERLFFVVTLAILGAGALTSLTGCGYSSGYFGQHQQTYTVDVTGTSGALSHSATVTLTVE